MSQPKNSRQPWSDKEIQILKESYHLSEKELADLLGRSVQSVRNARFRFKNGDPRKRKQPIRPYTEDEDKTIKDLVGKATSAQIAKRLDRRSAGSVRQRMLALGLSSGGRGAWWFSPYGIENRPLVAKTCTKCGSLEDASSFKRQTSGVWGTECAKCQAIRNKKEYSDLSEDKRSDVNKKSKDYAVAVQENSLQSATRRRDPYLEEDHKILSDPTLTVPQKAEMLGRTVSGVANACSKNGYLSKASPILMRKYPKWSIDRALESSELATHHARNHHRSTGN